MPATLVWFLRHGEVEERYVGSFLGRTDANLSPLGRHQAAAQAAYLEDSPLDAVLCSPRRRALDGAAPLAKAKGLKLEVRKGFAEMDFGEWDGLHWPAIEARDAGHAAAWQADAQNLAAPSGESGQVFQDRVSAALEEALREFSGRTIAVVGHAGTSRCILAHALRARYVEMFRFAQDYGCVNACAFAEFPTVALWNFVPGPRAARQGD